MKLSKLYILPLLTLFVFGCTDLVENPVGRLIPDGFIKSEKDVQTAIYGAYGKIASDNYWGREKMCIRDRPCMAAEVSMVVVPLTGTGLQTYPMKTISPSVKSSAKFMIYL